MGDLGSIPGLGRSPGERNGILNQYSCLENSKDRGSWRATVHGVAKSRTRLKQLSMQAHTLSLFSTHEVFVGLMTQSELIRAVHSLSTMAHLELCTRLVGHDSAIMWLWEEAVVNQGFPMAWLI